MKTKKKADEILETFSYTPKTPLGKKLMEMREKIITSGERMLDWEDIEEEISDRRGGYESHTR